MNLNLASDSWSRGVRHENSNVDVYKNPVQKRCTIKLWQLCKTLYLHLTDLTQLES